MLPDIGYLRARQAELPTTKKVATTTATTTTTTTTTMSTITPVPTTLITSTIAGKLARRTVRARGHGDDDDADAAAPTPGHIPKPAGRVDADAPAQPTPISDHDSSDSNDNDDNDRTTPHASASPESSTSATAVVGKLGYGDVTEPTPSTSWKGRMAVDMGDGNNGSASMNHGAPGAGGSSPTYAAPTSANSPGGDSGSHVTLTIPLWNSGTEHLYAGDVFNLAFVASVLAAAWLL